MQASLGNATQTVWPLPSGARGCPLGFALGPQREDVAWGLEGGRQRLARGVQLNDVIWARRAVPLALWPLAVVAGDASETCWAHLAAEHVPRSHQEQRARHAQGTQGMPCEATLLPTFAIPALLYHNAQCAHMDSGEKKTAMPLNGRLCTCSARLECWRLWKARRGSR